MLNSAVFDLMMHRLGNRSAQLMRAQCVIELEQAIRQLERGPVKPWFLEDSVEDELVAAQGYINLPGDFLMEIEEGTFEVENEADGWHELTKVSRDKLRKETANAHDAFPEGYAIWGNRFLLGPAPDQAYAYRFDYYKRTTPPTDNGVEATNDWVKEFLNLVTYKALIIIARDHIQSDRMAGNFEKAYNDAYSDFLREVEARKVANETLLLTDEES